MDHEPGLLEPFLSQICMSVRGWGYILGVGSCASDLGSGICGGGGIDIVAKFFCWVSGGAFAKIWSFRALTGHKPMLLRYLSFV